MAKKKNKNFGDLQEKAISWFWVILFLSTILYLRWLLVEMHDETTRLSDERERFQKELRAEREESQTLYQRFHADLNKSIKEAVESLNQGEFPYKYLRP